MKMKEQTGLSNMNVSLPFYLRDGRLLTGEAVSAVYGRTELYQAVTKFVAANKDNPWVDNPFDAYGGYEDKECLFDAYDNNIGVCYCDELSDDLLQKLDETVRDSMENPDVAVSQYRRNMAGVAGMLVLAQREDAEPEYLINMVEHSMHNGYVNKLTLESMVRNIPEYVGETINDVSEDLMDEEDAMISQEDENPFSAGEIMAFEISKARRLDPSHQYMQVDGHQIDVYGGAIETSYEYFTGGVSVYEDGKLLFLEDASCVGSYHFESYTMGRFTSLEDTVAYLKEQYPDATPMTFVDEPMPHVKESYPTVWSDPKYAKEREMEAQGGREALLDRIVFKDLGEFTGKHGKYHRVDFAYACDNKTVGQDKPVANPYVMSSKKKGPSGKMETVHSYYLSDDIYKTLMAHANVDGLKDSKWSGVIAAKVEYPADRNGKSKVSVNLTRQAVRDGNVVTPSEPFDEKQHNAFVKSSLAEVRKKREVMAENKLGDVQKESPETSGVTYEA